MRLRLLTLVIAVLAAFPTLASAQAYTETQNETLAFSLGLPLPPLPGVNDTGVDLEGQVHLQYHITVNTAGKFMLRYHANAKAVGVGWDTGSTYQGNGTGKALLNVNPNGAFTTELSLRVNLIGQGAETNMYLDIKFKLALDADGNVKAFITDFEITAK